METLQQEQQVAPAVRDLPKVCPYCTREMHKRVCSNGTVEFRCVQQAQEADILPHGLTLYVRLPRS